MHTPVKTKISKKQSQKHSKKSSPNIYQFNNINIYVKSKEDLERINVDELIMNSGI